MKGERHRGHSALWLDQEEMQDQQKTWPQGVAVGTSLGDKHRGHLCELGGQAGGPSSVTCRQGSKLCTK